MQTHDDEDFIFNDDINMSMNKLYLQNNEKTMSYLITIQ